MTLLLKGHRKNSFDLMVTNTTRKRKIIEEFGDETGLFITGRYTIAHSQAVNPRKYSVATEQVHCLKDEDFVRSPVNSVRRKVKGTVFDALPDHYGSLQDCFNNGPLPGLYNAVYATIYPNMSINDHGYAKTDSMI